MDGSIPDLMMQIRQPEYHPVTPDRHASRWWNAPSSYSWAAREITVPLVSFELSRAVLHLPVAFMRQGETLMPFAIVGVESGVNLFVAHDGIWTGGYVPAALRSRPFALLPLQDGRRALCIDEEAGRVGTEQGPSGHAFFSGDGKLSHALQQFLVFLSAVEESRQSTRQACLALEAHGVLVPWDIELKSDTGSRRLEGLFRLDEAKLDALPDEAFLGLRRARAMPLAYAQMLSMQHIQVLGYRASARLQALQQPMTPVTASGDLDLSFLERGDTVKL
jgi:hypothetical protein